CAPARAPAPERGGGRVVRRVDRLPRRRDPGGECVAVVLAYDGGEQQPGRGVVVGGLGQRRIEGRRVGAQRHVDRVFRVRARRSTTPGQRQAGRGYQRQGDCRLT